MKRLETLLLYCFVILLLLIANTALAASVTQALTLQPGWNAVFLEVNPDPDQNDPHSVFGTIPDLISVWRWNSSSSTVEFIQDPNVPVPEQSIWLTYYHNNGEVPAELQNLILTNLHAIHGNTAYLIQRGGTASVDHIVTGEPVVPDINWKPNEYNLVGFHLAAAGEPTFTNFFSSSPAHADQQVYVLRNNSWQEILASDPMQQGEPFWIYCKGSSEFNGPVGVQLGIGNGLQYGKILDKLEIIIKNETTGIRHIELTPSSSGFPLYYWYFDQINSVAMWNEITPGSPLSLTVGVDSYGNGESQRVRLGVKRSSLSPDEVITTNLTVTDLDGYGTNIRIPASVTGINYAGLWGGYASINKAEEARKGDNIPVSTGSELSIRLLVHVDQNYQASLLQQVIQMWQEGGLIDDPQNLGMKIVDPDNPGHFVLLADDSLTPYFSGAALLDGRPVGRRISSAAFGNFYELNGRPAENLESYRTFQQTPFKILENGTFQRGETLVASLWLPKDDPSNPFVHKYHPDHLPPQKKDDPDNPGTDIWNQNRENMFDITRSITLQFSETDSDGNLIFGAGDLDWGSSKVGGIYTENISGLHRDILSISGTFVLQRISDVGTLIMEPPVQ